MTDKAPGPDRRPDMSEDPRECIAPVALVTGASKRIGREIALGLAKDGFDVALHFSRSAADAEQTADEIRALGRSVSLLQADLEDPIAAARLTTETVAALGSLGVVVNNASMFEKDSWDDCSSESWAAHMAVNLESPFRIIQSFAKLVPEAQHGVAINIIDQRVFNLTPHFTSYTLSKSGLWTLTQTLALALAPKIRVAAVGPGPTIQSPRQSAEEFEAQSGIIPLRRRTAPAAIARAVRFIVDAPSYTGQMMALDGGEHLGWQQEATGVYIDE